MTGDYAVVSKGVDGQWRWAIKSANHETIATGESHKLKWMAKRAVRRINPNIPLTVK